MQENYLKCIFFTDFLKEIISLRYEIKILDLILLQSKEIDSVKEYKLAEKPTSK